MFQRLYAALVQAIQQSKAPGGVAYIGSVEETFFFEAAGFRQVVPVSKPARRDTIYDVASLTKVLATTTAVLLLKEDGALDLDRSVFEYLPIPEFQTITIRHLLTHTAGLPSVRPFYRDTHTVTEMIQRYVNLGFEWEPGTHRNYSDAGFLILGKVVELVAHDSLDAFCRKRIFRQLGMERTAFNPPRRWAGRCAATEQCPWRGKLMVGVVHDENAYAVGGVAGHAGLFSTAEDIARYCRALLGGKLLRDESVAEMTALGQVPSYPWQGLGWGLDPWSSETQGYLPSRTAFGHSGWTGSSLWMDRATGLFAILLGNTCHPTRRRQDNETLRRTFYTGVARAFYPSTTATHSGLDRLVHDYFEPLAGRRVALLTHHAAIDQLSRPILDVLGFAPDADIRLLYSPEHGLRGQAEAGEKVPSLDGPVPVISLYGDRRAPTEEELKDVDLFVVDLQDVGARYYTYIATMKDCLAACGKAGKTLLILDRPNPIGGAILEGTVAEDTSSAVCCAPIPIRHGMTMGELACFFVGRVLQGPKPEVIVYALDNWERTRLFNECSLPWAPPSPNIPTPETALLYVGMCLFEGTNLNEGRGTDTPFHLVGAPWMDPEEVLRQVAPEERAGCRLEPVTYTPVAMPGKASNPRYRDQRCQGIRITVEDGLQVRSFTLALALISAIRRVHLRTFEWKDSFDVLACTKALRVQLERGETASQIVSGLTPALRVFDEKRPLLYE